MKTQLKDMIGKTVKVGDHVAVNSFYNLGMCIGIVESIGTKNAKVRPLFDEFGKVLNDKIESIPVKRLIKVKISA